MSKNTGTTKHKHKWSKPYHGIFNGPVRVCLGGPCGAMRFASGRIIRILERVPGTEPKPRAVAAKKP